MGFRCEIGQLPPNLRKPSARFCFRDVFWFPILGEVTFTGIGQKHPKKRFRRGHLAIGPVSKRKYTTYLVIMELGILCVKNVLHRWKFERETHVMYVVFFGQMV